MSKIRPTIDYRLLEARFERREKGERLKDAMFQILTIGLLVATVAYVVFQFFQGGN